MLYIVLFTLSNQNTTGIFMQKASALPLHDVMCGSRVVCYDAKRRVNTDR